MQIIEVHENAFICQLSWDFLATLDLETVLMQVKMSLNFNQYVDKNKKEARFLSFC